LGMGVYIDKDVEIGNYCKIQNNVSVFNGVEIKDFVFIGPHVCFTNDKLPRAYDSNLQPIKKGDWKVSKTIVAPHVSIGANATILPGLNIGQFAMIGAGAVVTKDVPEFTVVAGNPARIIGKTNNKGDLIK
jgi:UDP-2-acetamido-3-amino-2,3-dideoxy-glucuronate N-acetyltransferase